LQPKLKSKFKLSFLGWVINWVDSILVAKYFDLKYLGLYRTSVLLTSMLFSLIMMPVATVIFPVFSKFGADKIKILNYYNRINELIILVLFPVGFGIFFLSDLIEIVIFGEKWIGIGKVLGVLCMSESIGSLTGINPIIYQSIGKPELQPKISVFLAPIFIVVYIQIAPLGIQYLVWAKLILSVVTLPVNSYLLSSTLGTNKFYFFHQGKWIFLSTSIMSFLIYFFQGFFFGYFNDIFLLITTICLGIIIYFFSIWLFHRELIFKAQEFLGIEVLNLNNKL
jgi:O-antigen/teichoic acid export membrane protein